MIARRRDMAQLMAVNAVLLLKVGRLMEDLQQISLCQHVVHANYRNKCGPCLAADALEREKPDEEPNGF